MSLFNHVETGSSDYTLISKIADRYMAFVDSLPGRKSDLPTKMTITMDLEVVHYIYTLDLQRMLDGKFADLMHDIHGIHYHLDRETGAVEGKDKTFSPRYAGIQMGECWYCMQPVEPDNWTIGEADGLMHQSCLETHKKELLVEADLDECFGPQE